jgi:hypothetical protein
MGKPKMADLLVPLLTRAEYVCDAGIALIDLLRGEEATEATFPESTVARLHFVAVSSYRSALLCLSTPETSLASYGLIRSLLEVWAHLHFIGDKMAGDSRCRALRYEQGALAEWEVSIRKAPENDALVIAHEAHAKRAADVESLWQELGCSGKPRTRKHVDNTLNKLATLPKMDWIPGVWSASSASTHAYGVDFLLHVRNGVTELLWAIPSQRTGWLAFATATYSYLTVTACNILGEGDARINVFQGEVGVFLNSTEMRLAASGKFNIDVGSG